MGLFPDAEDVLMDLLDPFGHVCSGMPKKDEFESLLPIIFCQRIGGGVSPSGIDDVPMMMVLVFHRTRPEARQLSARCREAILGAGRTNVNGVLVDWTREATGVQNLPDLNPDNRAVESTYWMCFRKR